MTWTLPFSIGVFAAAAIVIAFAGTRLSRLADRLADRTGLGEAVIGAVLLGGSTSLPGITASVVAAATGHPVLALANAYGGIAVQTAFLAIADLFHPRINLEHAAAEAANMMQGALLITLLSLLMLAMIGPDVVFWGVHPATLGLFASYGFGVRLVYLAHTRPMWKPRRTPDTRPDLPAQTPAGESIYRLWIEFGISSALVIAAGWAVSRAGAVIAGRTGLSESLVGSLLVAIATSLPELVTTVAAVRQGALTLAVGGILGGNTFDTLFAAVSDIAYRDGSIYHAASRRELLLVALTILMTGVILLGLLHRERRGVANIGFESVLVLMLYLLGLLLLRFS